MASRVSGGLLALALLVVTARVAAFCPTRTCAPAECGAGAPSSCQSRSCERDARGCVSEGRAAYHALPCLAFAIDARAAARAGLEHERVAAIVTQAFERWTSVSCPGGGSPGLRVSLAAVVDVSGAFFCAAEPERNLGVWTFPAVWPHAADSVGYTSLWLDENGRVLDADVELNIEWLRDSGGELESVLLAVATHEAGHVLGLDHSDDPAALMAASYAEGLTGDRGLGSDDIEGVCGLYPPASSTLECPLPVVSDVALRSEACRRTAASDGAGCVTARSGGRAAGELVAFAVAVAIASVRRTRRRQK